MKRIKLTQGKYALVDNEDFEYLNQWKWYTTKQSKLFYAKRLKYLGKISGKYKYKMIYLHRELLNPPLKMEIDHIDNNPLNNQRNNLRICTHSENQRNVKFRRNKTAKIHSKYKGVWFRKNKVQNKWVAEIRKNNKKINLGSFNEEEEAVIAYNEAAKKYHGEFAYLNKIQ